MPAIIISEAEALREEVEQLKKRIAYLDNENIFMYAALVEASNLGGTSALRCKVELQRIARNDAAQQSVQPTIATAALEDSPFETGIRRNAVVQSNRNSG